MHKKLCFVLLLAGVLGGIPRVFGATDPDLIGWWTFDEGTGTTVHDSSGHGYDGTFLGDPEWVAGMLGGALDFDGDDDEIPLPDRFPIGSTSNTFAAWIKVPLVGTAGLDSGERVGILMGNYSDAPNTNWELHGAGEMRMWWNGGEVDARGTTNLRDNTWHHIAWVRDKAAGGFFLYIDGQLETKTSTVGSDITFNTNHRIGGDNRGSPPNFHGLADDLQLYSRALSQEEVVAIMAGPVDYSVASSPSPQHNAIDVPRDAVLSWTPGAYAATHDVYLGAVIEDVNAASRTDPRNVLVSQDQVEAEYAPTAGLEYGQTYYWRIDEVNAALDTTIYKGKVWSFTVEPLAYPLPAASIVATASGSASNDEGPQKTIDGSGLDDAGLHSTGKADMWLSDNVPAGDSAWIRYTFDAPYVLHAMQVWNHNSELESVVGLGIKDATIEYSVDGIEWTALEGTHQFARASSGVGYASNTAIDFGGEMVQYVRITALNNWGGILPQFGLSEVRFLYMPMRAREPKPAAGMTEVDPQTTLTWRSGRGAATHNVYLSIDEQAVIDGTALVDSTTESSYEAALDLNTTYYWKIDEVNATADPSVWEGDVWSFSTKEYVVVDNFESYTNDSPDRIFQTWIDGLGFSADDFFPSDNPGNGTGAIVGYDPQAGGIMETAIVHEGRQSMPLAYDNSASPFNSETQRSFDESQDWTAHGIRLLVIHFRGETGNQGQLYVKINGTKVPYSGAATDIAEPLWHAWTVDLSTVSVSLTAVKKLTIGVEGANTSGILYIDDIELHPMATELITPAEPGDENLMAWWTFDEGTGMAAGDHSGHGYDGTIKGNPQWTTGMSAGALTFDGDADEVTMTPMLAIGSSSSTVTAWVKIPVAGTEGLGATTRVGILVGNYNDTPCTNWEFHSAGQTRFFWNGGEVDSRGTTDLRDNTWHHIAWVRDREANACYTYIDGRLEATATKAGTDITFVTTHRIGADNRASGVPFFHGSLDDLRIYDRALPLSEIAWLAGKKLPFDPRF